MKKTQMIRVMLAAVCAVCVMSACGSKEAKAPPVIESALGETAVDGINVPVDESIGFADEMIEIPEEELPEWIDPASLSENLPEGENLIEPAFRGEP